MKTSMIRVSKRTRYDMKQLKLKGETYDTLIQRLLKFYTPAAQEEAERQHEINRIQNIIDNEIPNIPDWRY